MANPLHAPSMGSCLVTSVNHITAGTNSVLGFCPKGLGFREMMRSFRGLAAHAYGSKKRSSDSLKSRHAGPQNLQAQANLETLSPYYITSYIPIS